MAGIRALLFLPFFFLISVHARAELIPQRLAVGQGISTPERSSPVNIAPGFVFQNPAVAADNRRPQITIEGENGKVNKGLGGEIELGTGTYGLGAGYYKNCAEKGCGRFGAIAAYSLDFVSLGAGYHENAVYSAGLVVGRKGPHRLGFVADFHGPTAAAAKGTTLGAGYTYASPDNYSFTFDASRAERGGVTTTQLSPGIYASTKALAVSVNYKYHLGQDKDSYENKLWIGAALSDGDFTLAVYKDLQNAWTAAFTVLLL